MREGSGWISAVLAVKLELNSPGCISPIDLPSQFFLYGGEKNVQPSSVFCERLKLAMIFLFCFWQLKTNSLIDAPVS